MDNKHTLIQWDDEKFSVHVAQLDEQHRRIIDLLNQIFAEMKDKAGKGVNIKKALLGLQTYAEFHLTAEENYFKLVKYPQTEQHIQAHAYFLQKVAEFKKKQEDNSLFATDIYYFMKDWLINHICTMDKQYSQWFNDHGIK